MPQAIIRLGLGRALIVPNSPNNLPLSGICNHPNTNIDLGKFGLWDSATPNFATYYPDATPEDLKPKDGDYSYPIFRALSEVIVHKNTNPVDFSQNNVLKKSLQLLVAETIYPNHEMLVGNELGVIESVEWQNAYKTAAGIAVPAGINARLKIDGKKVPGIVRSIEMNALHSVSVTVSFEWEKSHPNVSDDEFRNKLGTFDEKGNMYTRVATKILRYSEISLVPHGADPYARKVGEDGKILNPEKAARRDGTLSNSEVPKHSYLMFSDVSEDKVSLAEEEPTIPDVINNNDNNQTTFMNKEYLIVLALLMGLTGTEKMTDDELKSAVQSKCKDNAGSAEKLTEIQKELTELKAKAPETTELGAEDKAALTYGKTAITALQERAKKAYQAVKGDKAEQSYMDSLKEMTPAVLVTLSEQYETELNALQPLTCTKCKSTDVSRQSAQSSGADDTGGAGGAGGNIINLSAEEALAKASKVAAQEVEGKSISAFEEVETKK